MNDEARIKEERRAETGGFAFPQSSVCEPTSGHVYPLSDYFDAGGMTLRDWFAGLVMQATITAKWWDRNSLDVDEDEAFWMALCVYDIADAMIEARDNR